MARLLEGKHIAEGIKAGLKDSIAVCGRKLKLVSVRVGINPAGDVYVKSQKRCAESLGIEYDSHVLDKNTPESEIVEFIKGLNADASVSGIILQLPLPSGLDHRRICRYISPNKDVEIMNPENMGELVSGAKKLLPCTPAAVIAMLDSTGIDYTGKEAVVVGHSGIVGKPLALALADRLATVTICHAGTSKAGKLQDHVMRADILVVAVGKPGLIKGEWIKKGAVVIDVGINRVEDKIVGDVEFDKASQNADWITPVPGGVGPLTVTMLMRNLVEVSSCL